MLLKVHIRTALGTLLTLCALSAEAQNTPPDTLRFSLDSCLRYAYSHSITMQKAHLGYQSAEADYNQARMNFTPSLSASAGQTYNIPGSGNNSRSGNYGLNANLTLFDGLSNYNTYKQNALNLTQAEYTVSQTRNQVTRQILQTYLTVLMNQERLKYQQEVLKTSQEQCTEGEVKYKVGRILESDYLLLQAAYQTAANDIENTTLTIAANLVDLKDLLCITGTSVLAVEHHGDTLGSAAYAVPELDSVLRAAYRTLPDLEISRLNVAMAEYSVKQARAAYMPSLALSAGTGYSENKEYVPDGDAVTNSGWNSNVGLNLSIPILQRGSAHTQVVKSKIALQEAELQNQQLLLDLNDEIEDQQLAARQALNQFRTTELTTQAYKTSYEIYAVKYKAGSITTVELLQQQDKYLSALNDYLQSKYNFLLARKLLDIYMGQEITL